MSGINREENRRWAINTEPMDYDEQAQHGAECGCFRCVLFAVELTR